MYKVTLKDGILKGFIFSQEPITRSLHLLYKP